MFTLPSNVLQDRRVERVRKAAFVILICAEFLFWEYSGREVTEYRVAQESKK
jgi:hypothetical protein